MDVKDACLLVGSLVFESIPLMELEGAWGWCQALWRGPGSAPFRGRHWEAEVRERSSGLIFVKGEHSRRPQDWAACWGVGS